MGMNLKRAVQLGITIAALGFSGCVFNKSNASLDVTSSLRDQTASLKDYRYAIIYDSETASFIEIKLQRIMEEIGLKVIGEREASSYIKVLGVRYVFQSGTGRTPGLSEPGPEVSLIISLEDVATDKTLVTVEGYSASDGLRARSRHEVQERAYNAAATKLRFAFDTY